MLWFGLFFVVLVLFKPEGIAGMVASLRGRAVKRGAAQATASPQLQAR
jgi:branched-chain amino acid transport system permease protein